MSTVSSRLRQKSEVGTVSEHAGRWFVSIQVEEEQEAPVSTMTTAIGIDVGIKTLATLSDGTTFDNPRPLKHAQKRLRRLERQQSRRKLGGKNRKKTCKQLAKQHARVTNICKDTAHKLTNYVCKNTEVLLPERSERDVLAGRTSLAIWSRTRSRFSCFSHRAMTRTAHM